MVPWYVYCSSIYRHAVVVRDVIENVRSTSGGYAARQSQVFHGGYKSRAFAAYSQVIRRAVNKRRKTKRESRANNESVGIRTWYLSKSITIKN